MSQRTNIELDEKLLKQAARITGLKTKKSIVNHALQELVERSKQKDLLKLAGKTPWQGSLSKMRKMRK